jgi:peroxiredoxin
LPSTIEQMHREHRPRGLAVVAVNIDEPADRVAAWVQANKVTTDVVLDPGARVTTSWGVTATPTAFVLDRQHRLVAKALGPKAWTSKKGRALLEALLAP